MKNEIAKEIAKELGFSPSHVGRIYNKMCCEYGEYDVDFWENREKDTDYIGWHITADGEVEYGNHYLCGLLIRDKNGRLFFNGNERRDEYQSSTDTTTIFSK